MNKIEIIEELNKLDISKDDYWVLGSASLVLRNLLDNANDIDLAITNEVYNRIKDKLVYLGSNNNYKWYKVNDLVECCIDIKDSKVDELEPYNLLNLEYYYNNFIKDSTREKDLEKKMIIEKELKK